MTMPSLSSSASSPPDALSSLSGVCAVHGLDDLSGRLVELRTFLADDLHQVEGVLQSIAHGDAVAEQSARHLLNGGGKRLRPICVALASHLGAGFGAAAREYAVAVELIHNATLLHDDVVDLGDRRRGVDTSRVVYGNAASIFGGDWLLVEALERVHRAGQPEVVTRLLALMKEMVLAESEQLACRGELRTQPDAYFRIIDGKTAALFRWAMYAGARAGGLDAAAQARAEEYGTKLGMAFQLVDDVLDVAGEAATTGKAVLTDLREGKMTYPLILAVQRDAELCEVLTAICRSDEVVIDVALAARVAKTMQDTGAAADCLELAEAYCRGAVECLAGLPPTWARAALEGVALATPNRSR